MPPADLGDLYRAWLDRERRWDYRVGTLAAAVGNMLSGKDARTLHAADFFGGLEATRPDPPSDEELERKIAAAMAAAAPPGR